MFELVLIGIGIIIISTYLIKYYKSRRAVRQLIDQLPGPKSYPIIGSMLEYVRIPRAKIFEMSPVFRMKYGSLIRSWWGSVPIVHILSPEGAEVILTSRQNIDKAFAYESFKPWLGTGLLTSSGSKWHKRRKMLTPAFHFSILQTFFPIFVENADVLTKKLEYNLNKEEFDVLPFISKCTLDIICEAAMGVKLNAQSGGTPEYIESVHKMTKIIMAKIRNPFLWIEMLYAISNTKKQEMDSLKTLHKMSLSVIQQRKLQRTEEKFQRVPVNDLKFERIGKKAFLDMMLDISEESDIEMSDEDIREEVDTFMFEGHDTTSSAISTAIHFLGSHSDIQDEVAQELFSVFGASNRCPTMNDISQLKYLEKVIKESLRLCPPVPAIARTLSEDVHIGGYLIPSGTQTVISVVGVHRDPSHYPNPEKFDPENFSLENCAKRHPFAFIPFSAGPRNCIGQKFAKLEEKVILSTLLRKYKITALQAFQDMCLVPETVLRPDNGVKIKISRRTL